MHENYFKNNTLVKNSSSKTIPKIDKDNDDSRYPKRLNDSEQSEFVELKH